MNPKIGDKVRIIKRDREFSGIIMPNETNNIVIKLDNGYNVGIKKEGIKEIKIIEKYNPKKAKGEKKMKKNKNLPNISILHTGGTIASKVDYRTGGVVARFTPEEILELFPELKDIANIDSRLLENMWTEDFRFKNFTTIANAILKEIKNGADGIIITQGTDFMCICAAILAFMLQNLPIPVILTGAQRSSDRGSSDAAMNLICAAEFIKQSDYKGVAVCMHKTQDDKICHILPPTKSRKMHSSRRDAFRAINTPPIAEVDYEKRKIKIIDKKEYKRWQKVERFEPRTKMQEKAGLIKTHPNMFPEQFLAFKGFKGLIIEGSGLGHAPIDAPNKDCDINKKNLDAIRKLVKDGTIIAMTTQTIYGSVQMHVYSKGIDLVKENIIQAKMLPETALVKLAWLLGNYKDKEKIKKLMQKNLVGELFDRIEEDTFLI